MTQHKRQRWMLSANFFDRKLQNARGGLGSQDEDRRKTFVEFKTRTRRKKFRVEEDYRDELEKDER